MTVRDAHKNFAYSTVLTPPSPGVSGTSLVVQAGDGAKFPTPPFNVTIWPVGVNPITTNAEIARCTAIATDTLTITRAQEGSTARTVIATDQIAATITAKTLQDAENSAIYGGDFAAGNYSDGDIVVYNGIAYLCVLPTSAAPAAWPGGIAPAAQPLVVNYGTTLPASPTDGMEAILVDSITNPTYQWRFRYNLGSTSAYKWEFVGGSPRSVEWRGTNNVTSTLVVIGNTLTSPRAGDYDVEFGAGGQIESANATDVAVLLFVNGAQQGGDWQSLMGRVNGLYDKWGLGRRFRITGVGAGLQFDVRGSSMSSITINFMSQYLSIWPVRVA